LKGGRLIDLENAINRLLRWLAAPFGEQTLRLSKKKYLHTHHALRRD
jgi:hypothetical protein